MSNPDTATIGRRVFAQRRRQQANETLSEVAGELEFADLEILAESAYLIGNEPAAIAAWSEAHQRFNEQGDVRRAARCGFWLSLVLLLAGDAAQGAGWLERIRRVLKDRPDTVETGLSRVIAGIMAMGRDAEEADAALSQALALGERHDDADLLALALLGRGQLLIQTGRAPSTSSEYPPGRPRPPSPSSSVWTGLVNPDHAGSPADWSIRSMRRAHVGSYAVSPDLMTNKETIMSELIYSEAIGDNPAVNYQRFFVPRIGGPIAEDLVAAARLNAGERVLDVGCGTGVVARLAAAKVGTGGSVSGLDVNPGMLAVARETATSGAPIHWYEASAEAMPLPDDAFDVVLCQMSLQFMDDRVGALREMRRVLAPAGRVVLNVPGPTPPLFAALAEGVARHVDPAIAGFIHDVFSLDADDLRALAGEAGFEQIEVSHADKELRLPEAEKFLWQYIRSTPMGGLIAQRNEEELRAMQDEVCANWAAFATDNGMAIEVGISTLACR